MDMRKASVMVIAVMVCFASLVFIGGCAKKDILKEGSVMQEKQAVVKEEPMVKERPRAGKETADKGTKEAARDATVKEKSSAGTTGKEAKKDKAAPEGVEVKLANIHFDFDKYTLRPEVREMLKQHAELLARHKNYQVTIEGHCDERGTAEYNLALGERRADAAKAYMVQLGVDEKRIKTISYGFEKPLNPGHNEEAWSKNRRDNFVTVRQ